MSREIGDRSSVARALYNAAECFRLQGQLQLARSNNEESLRIRGTLDPASASAALKTLHAQAVGQSVARAAFEAARALVQIEGARSPATAAERLAILRKEALARGFGLFAR